MRRDALLELVLFLATAASFALASIGPAGGRPAVAPGPRPDGCVRVVTWNVGGAEDGGVPLAGADVRHVLQRLVELDADLVFLQELDGSGQARSLLDTLGSGWSARWTGPEPDRRLDYVFVDPRVYEVVGALVWKRQRAGSMDHDPLVVDLGPIER